MGKVITVWGSPGSGKSMFSCILAKALTRDKRKAIIINAEISVPMLPVWLPEQIIQTNASVGQVLSSVEIDTTLVASHVTVLKSYPFIGLMGYSAGENPLSYPEIKYAMVPILGIGFSLAPIWYLRSTAASYKKHLNEELETAISIITTSYLRTEDLIRAVKENLPYINEPVCCVVTARFS